MDNIHANVIIGMTLNEADDFIYRNNVYFEDRDIIGEIRVAIRDGELIPQNQDGCWGRLYVEIVNEKIIKIIHYT